MTTEEIISKIEKMNSLLDAAKSLSDEAEAIKDEIKEYMGDEEVLVAGKYKVLWTKYSSSRVDTKALREMYPDIAKQMLRESFSRRFSISDNPEE